MADYIETRAELKKEGGMPWDLSAVWIEEHKLLKTALKNYMQSNLKVGVGGDAAKKLVEKARSSEAIEQAKADMRNRFNPKNREGEQDRALLEAAQSRVFEQRSPTAGTVRTWQVIFWCSFLVEIIVFLMQILLQGSSPLLIFIALFLAAGGYLTGHAIGGMLFKDDVKHQHKSGEHYLTDRETTAKITGFFISGMIIIAGAILFRLSGSPDDNPVVLGGVTALLALFIIIAEASHYHYKEKREQYLDCMFKAQCAVAVREHNRFMTEGQTGKRDDFTLLYLSEVDKQG